MGWNHRLVSCDIIMGVWKIMFLSKWVICRFHVNLPGCTRVEVTVSQSKRSKKFISLNLKKIATKGPDARARGRMKRGDLFRYVHIYKTYIYMYIYKYTCIYIYIYLCMYICVCVCSFKYFQHARKNTPKHRCIHISYSNKLYTYVPVIFSWTCFFPLNASSARRSLLMPLHCAACFLAAQRVLHCKLLDFFGIIISGDEDMATIFQFRSCVW